MPGCFTCGSLRIELREATSRFIGLLSQSNDSTRRSADSCRLSCTRRCAPSPIDPIPIVYSLNVLGAVRSVMPRLKKIERRLSINIIGKFAGRQRMWNRPESDSRLSRSEQLRQRVLSHLRGFIPSNLGQVIENLYFILGLLLINHSGKHLLARPSQWLPVCGT